MSVALDSPPKDKTSVPPSFPANGMTKACSRGLVGQLEVLQPADQAKPERIIVMLSDSGDVAAVSKNLLDDNYTITRSKIATTLVLGEIDRLPDNAELMRIFSGGIPGALDMRASVTQNMKGNSSITINPDTLK